MRAWLAASAIRSASTSGVAHAGVLIGISRMVVTPPAAAAAEPESKSSRSGWSGARQWKWVSTMPGSTSRPRASTLARAGGRVPGSATTTTRPSRTPTSSRLAAVAGDDGAAEHGEVEQRWCVHRRRTGYAVGYISAALRARGSRAARPTL